MDRLYIISLNMIKFLCNPYFILMCILQLILLVLNNKND